MKIWKSMFATPFTIAASMCICATPSTAQSITDGGLTGTLVTRGALVFGSTTITFLTVPATHHFILTQACYTFGDGTNLRFNGVGGEHGNQGGSLIDPQATLDNTECKQFTPGLVYQPGDAVVFRNNGPSPQRVYINGVMTGGRLLPPVSGGLEESPSTPAK